MGWRWAAASQIGASHLKMGTRRQDACHCFLVDGALCAIVCDGAGSAAFGGEGASLVARAVSNGLREHFRSKSTLPSDDDVWGWVDLARDQAARAAEARSCGRREFASTLVLLVASDEGALVTHVGDGAVVVRDADGGWRALSWPENGEYASTTYFVTDDPAPRLRISRHAADFDAAAVFSDGIEMLALNLAAEIPHQPFFDGMIAPIDALQRLGKDAGLSTALARYLASPKVCERTDDDKSLILASAR